MKNVAGTAVVTGGTGGIGLATARGLAGQGYAVTIVGRDPGRGATARAELAAAGPAPARFVRADLSSLTGVSDLAATLRASGPVDVLVNNVGGSYRRHGLTTDGIEAAFALSHLSGYLLTELLVGDMVDRGRGRIVNLSSGAVRVADRTPLDRVEVSGRYFGFTAYGRAKLANLAYTTGLARRLRGTGVTALSADPGGTATDMGRSMRPDSFPWPMKLAFPLIYVNLYRTSVTTAASSSIIAATSDQVEPGSIVGVRGRRRAVDPRATDPATIAAVTALSRELCARHLPQETVGTP
ncbi:SDR family NAD(P)-dependent oxidoreductase [Micromonospora cathayae]|uniref:SDR family NAD(P)-dependent oxidoreductase n=1 Tax=Micromonospora cathayae TaxID=3028804 RepID=A0ABY7ZLF6_9ACTN|nr:SDR family NAD(P)-dependent oxidoreductase [Micromonospora sp. HUAS 3]WDZ83596.1 SDR family NAD(P)-dependent oxidoreductase [Micromonospora sp. HUAS 3]